MHRYSPAVLAVVLFFAIGMMAQQTSGGSSQTDQSGGYSSQTGTPSNQQPGMGTAPQQESEGVGTQTDSSQNGSYGTQSGTYGSQSNTASAKEKTFEGCVVRQETDYFIFPKSGQPEHIASTGQDVSSHLGHHVKLHGTEQATSASTAYGSTSGGVGGTAAGSTSGATGSSTGSTGNVGANTAGTSGSTTEGGGTSAREIVVERVDMVSETCPADIQRNIRTSGMSTSPQ